MGHVISKAYETIVNQKYNNEEDVDIIADDLMQENLCLVGSIVSMVDYIYGMNNKSDDFKNTMVSIEKKLIGCNYHTIALVEMLNKIDSISKILDDRATQLNIYDLSYYDKTNIFTRLITYNKFKNSNTLQTGIKVAIGGGKNINLDFINIKEQLFNSMYYNTLLISSIRENQINGNKLPELLLDLLLALISLNILFNIDIEKYDGKTI